MYEDLWKSFWGPARVEDIDAAERTLNVKFPVDFRTIVEKFDAAKMQGDPYAKFYNEHLGADDAIDLGVFYSFSHKTSEIDFASRNGFGHKRSAFTLPLGVVAFSSTGRGDPWCFDYRNVCAGMPCIKIYHLAALHPSAQELSFVSSSFGEAISKLQFD